MVFSLGFVKFCLNKAKAFEKVRHEELLEIQEKLDLHVKDM